MKKIVVENTTYSLLIYFLLEKDWQESTYILTTNYFSDNFLQNIKKKLKVYESKIPFIEKDSILKKIRRYYYEKIFWNLFSILNIKNIFFGNDNLEVSRFFKKNKFNLLEDGMINYIFLKIEKTTTLTLKDFIKLEFKKYKNYGIENNVKKIYLTGLAPIPEEIAHKVEIVDLKNLWNKKTIEEQNEILDIFSFDLDIIENIKDRDIILFTQPLSEDNITTEEEKIEIYSRIVKKYSKERLIIKTHPREKTDYKNLFKEYLVLDNPFPFEILNFLDVKLKKAITLFSTAALGLEKGVKIDFYGTEVHPKILEKIGSCDSIMKRNCFLEEE